MLFKEQQKLTLIIISELMATTVKREIIITRIVGDRVAYRTRTHRKEYFLAVTSDVLVFDGWSLRYAVDVSTANRMYNFVTEKPRDLGNYIHQHNVNPRFDKWYKIYWQPGIKRGEQLVPLFESLNINA